MRLKNNTGFAVATAAAMLFSTAIVGTASAADTATVQCKGVNGRPGDEVRLPGRPPGRTTTCRRWSSLPGSITAAGAPGSAATVASVKHVANRSWPVSG